MLSDIGFNFALHCREAYFVAFPFVTFGSKRGLPGGSGKETFFTGDSLFRVPIEFAVVSDQLCYLECLLHSQLLLVW